MSSSSSSSPSSSSTASSPLARPRQLPAGPAMVMEATTDHSAAIKRPSPSPQPDAIKRIKIKFSSTAPSLSLASTPDPAHIAATFSPLDFISVTIPSVAPTLPVKDRDKERARDKERDRLKDRERERARERERDKDKKKKKKKKKKRSASPTTVPSLSVQPTIPSWISLFRADSLRTGCWQYRRIQRAANEFPRSHWVNQTQQQWLDHHENKEMPMVECAKDTGRFTMEQFYHDKANRLASQHEEDDENPFMNRQSIFTPIPVPELDMNYEATCYQKPFLRPYKPLAEEPITKEFFAKAINYRPPKAAKKPLPVAVTIPSVDPISTLPSPSLALPTPSTTAPPSALSAHFHPFPSIVPIIHRKKKKKIKSKKSSSSSSADPRASVKGASSSKNNSRSHSPTSHPAPSANSALVAPTANDNSNASHPSPSQATQAASSSASKASSLKKKSKSGPSKRELALEKDSMRGSLIYMELSKATGPYQCPHCVSGVFQDAEELRRHSSKAHGEKSFICPVCFKGFLDTSKIKRHSVVHSGVKPFVCPLPGCDKSFNLDFNLRAHLRVHAGETRESRKTNRTGGHHDNEREDSDTDSGTGAGTGSSSDSSSSSSDSEEQPKKKKKKKEKIPARADEPVGASAAVAGPIDADGAIDMGGGVAAQSLDDPEGTENDEE